MKHTLAIALSLGLTLTGAGAALAQEKVALVIGNHDYTQAPDAETAKRDALAVARALRGADFDVTTGIDLDREAMRRVFTSFGEKIADADRVVFYYSGHAMRSAGASYMMPVNGKGVRLTDVIFDGVPLDLMLRQAARKEGKAVVFIDAAQLKGFTPQPFAEPGLADITAPDGVKVISAAAPGRAIRRAKDRDSRFAQLVIEGFLAPGAKVDEILADVTGRGPVWSTGEIADGLTLADLPPPIATDGDTLAREIELAFWQAAERTGDAADYAAYLDRYPNGIFADIARNRLGVSAEAPAPTPPVNPDLEAEKALHLSRIRRKQIQESLTLLGHDPRGIDGLFGPATRRAITSWQQANGLADTGYLTARQVQLVIDQGAVVKVERQRIEEQKRQQAIRRDNDFWSQTGAKGTPQGFRRYLDEYPEGLHAGEAVTGLERYAEAQQNKALRQERRVWKRALSQDTGAAYRDYLARYPKGLYARDARTRLDKIEIAERARARERRFLRIENALGLSGRDRADVQRRLNVMGYRTGPSDGQFTKKTRWAIKSYQASRGLPDTGYLTKQTLIVLVRDTSSANRGKVDGADVIIKLLDAIGK